MNSANQPALLPDAASKSVVPYEVRPNGTLRVKAADVMKTPAARRQIEALAEIRSAARRPGR